MPRPTLPTPRERSPEIAHGAAKPVMCRKGQPAYQLVPSGPVTIRVPSRSSPALSATELARQKHAVTRKLPVAHTLETAVNLRQPRVLWSKRRPAMGKSGPRLTQLQGPHCTVRAQRAMIAPARKHAVQSNHARHAVGSFTPMAAYQALSVAAQLARRTPLAQQGNIRSVATAC